jgi:hypothetical protein
MSTHVEQIEHQNEVLAIILRSEYRAEGIHFLTPDHYSMQLGYMMRPIGYQIQPHIHLPVSRTAQYTQEVLLIRNGVVRVDFYSDEKEFLTSKLLRSGDVILLIKGGHGFEILESAEIIEVKQGPYKADSDKERFNPSRGEDPQ